MDTKPLYVKPGITIATAREIVEQLAYLDACDKLIQKMEKQIAEAPTDHRNRYRKWFIADCLRPARQEHMYRLRKLGVDIH